MGETKGTNYRLSIASMRGIVQKHGFIIESHGRTLESSVSAISSLNLKSDLLKVLEAGLRSARSMVKHEDILYIEIPNQHLTNWLSGRVEYKKYSEELDAVFNVLESVDCRYKFMYVKNSYATELVKNTKVFLNEGSSLMDAFKDLN